MERITLDVVKQIYPLAKDVYEGGLDMETAQDNLVKNAGMNPNSAWGYVRVFRRMMEGKRYTRTINEDATRYFLEMILADFNQEALRLALSSVKQHIKYYRSRRPRGLLGIENIHREFSEKI